MDIYPDHRKAEKQRFALKLSTRQLSKEVGFHHTTYTRWVKGESELTDKNIEALTSFLDLPPVTFLKCRYRRLTQP